MAVTKLILDRQAKARVFTFGGTGSGEEAAVVFEKGQQATSHVVADFKGSIKLNSLTGIPVFNSGTSSTTAADTDDLPEGGNLYYTDTRVRANRLDQMAAPTADVSMNSQKITNVATPSASSDAATKGYVDATKEGLDIKQSVRAATTANITLSGTQTIDGVAVIAGDRVLVKDQSTGSENGIYTVAAGAWSRSSDATNAGEVTAGMFVFVEEGTTNGNAGFVLTTDNPITLGTTALSFTQFSGAGQIDAGAALTKTGNQLNVAVDDSSIEVSSDQLRVKASGITNAMLAGSIDLAAKVTGELPVANGGTGLSSVTSGRLLLGAGTSDMTELAGASNGDVVTWNGSAWVAQAPSGSSGYQRATTVSGTQDSANKTFTIGNAVSANSEQVFLNGQLLTPGSSNDYVLSGTTLTFQAAIDAPAATDTIRVYGTF